MKDRSVAAPVGDGAVDLGDGLSVSTDGFSVTMTIGSEAEIDLSPRQLHALIAYARGLGLLEG